MADSKKAALTLSTTDFDRPLVSIDGKMYAMRSPDELSAELARAARQLKVDWDKVDETEDLNLWESELNRITARAVAIAMVDLPDEVMEKLTLGIRRKITEYFFDSVRGEESKPTT
jgi:hypothetical protein